ncbi:hypothetical protein ILUMI_00942 [Ignelater luminosus]|uniref:Mismatch repair endonuclease PMS2 n=1 Tax=Ignelater luminosus TaxID=2038154 RepID=A0A8K0GPP5_IGNLU|nr:hypothetical protein ILUMI_00942 [Ignelater luminosus]
MQTPKMDSVSVTDPSTDNLDNTQVLLAEPDVIARINRNTVHRICSGQVVLSLAIAVKELVENAIDASATNIEVRLKEYGSELLEVSDNGSGVRKENFQSLTLKHYTSKLREFSDLECVETLGFRGEALSSLCALSNLTIVTRHSLAEYATKIQYDLNGKIINESPAAREQGTTVALENLFSTLPVRRKEFIKNLKREYSKMCQLLYAYCLVSIGIKFTCTNVSKAGSRSTVVATEGASSVRENIISIFGARQIPSLIEVEMIEPNEEILEEYKVKIVPGESYPFKFKLIISSAIHGNGRSTTDRQFFYINSRPCEPHKVIKLINEVYKQFNSNQYPFVFLNVNMERSLVDVNVTPDKRQIFFEKEKLLLVVLKSSLLEAFKNCPSTLKMQNLEIVNNQGNGSKDVHGMKRTLEGKDVKEENILNLFKKRLKHDNGSDIKQACLINNKNFNITMEKASMKEENLGKSSAEENLEKLILLAEKNCSSQVESDGNCKPERPKYVLPDNITKTAQEENVSGNIEQLDKDLDVLENIEDETLASFESKSNEEIKPDVTKVKQISHNEDITNPPKKSITVRSSMKYLQEALKRCHSKKNDDEVIKVHFRSEIIPAANKNAEQELQKQISKDMFSKMEIIGQFNLGFIITRLENDLFIIDQHATDEKYNFEQLQLNTVLENQVLVNPKSIELTAANEEILIENIETFRKNGFNFAINLNAPATKKVSLTAIPMSKNYIFGKDDIEEMLFMLREDANHAVCRPSRVRAMFASRACRKSVMVGCPLSQSDMRRLVDHMGQIDQPWNCPHGRPTMRHLVNLKLIQNR